MKPITLLSTALSALVLLTACTSAPKPCTPEWVEYKTDRILGEFARIHRNDVNRLRDFASALQDDEPSPLLMMQIPARIENFKDLARDFEAQALPELNAAIDQCGDPQVLVPAFTSFLRKEGVGEDVIEWVEVLAPLALERST